MAVHLHFPDGVIIRGASASDVLRTWGALQWTPIKDLKAIKVALRDRAWAWSQTTIDPSLDDADFLDVLATAHLGVVSYEATKVKPGLYEPGVRERAMLAATDTSYEGDLAVIRAVVEAGDDADDET